MKLRPIRILLIDQHQDDRASLRQKLLEASGRVRVFEAGTAETALDWFRAVQPDSVVMDLQLEDVTGTDLLNRITLEISKKPVPVFIWTRLRQNLPAPAASFGIRGCFEKDKNGEQALITALLNAISDQ